MSLPSCLTMHAKNSSFSTLAPPRERRAAAIIVPQLLSGRFLARTQNFPSFQFFWLLERQARACAGGVVRQRRARTSTIGQAQSSWNK